MAEASKALALATELIGQVRTHLSAQVAEAGNANKVDRAKFEERQSDLFRLARLVAENEAAKSIVSYAAETSSGSGSSDGLEGGLACTYVALHLSNLAACLFGREAAWGVSSSALSTFSPWVRETLSGPRFRQLAKAMLSRSHSRGGSLGLSSDHEGIREAFSRFAREKLAPVAETIHRKDQLIPEDLLQGMADLGVFGISIPEEFGGSFIDHRSMILATEELSIASLGAGGSVITRPEICAKAILSGGTDEQKQRWLPAIARGEVMVSVAVTEPNAGSDVANVQVTAKKDGTDYVINGEKTWCTFAGRSNVFILLARTGGEGHKGLTLFLVEKPPHTTNMTDTAENHQYAFQYRQPNGGTVTGHAIPTIGYRGMHSFAVSFENYRVPTANRIGQEGEGFVLQMKGFSGGRIQTAARAVGVMEAAFREGLKYASERTVFGKPLAEYPLVQEKLVGMAARIQASRQLAYKVGDLMDRHEGEREASLVKFLSCTDAEWVTREAMQVHGGMGYSEEYPVSRYFCDARVLSIFEGAEEVLGLLVIARQMVSETLQQSR